MAIGRGKPFFLSFKSVPLMILVFFVFGCSAKNATAPVESTPNVSLRLESPGTYGEVYYEISNLSKGLVVCFHGTGGSASGWTSGEKFNFIDRLHSEGYSILCPTSLNRSTKQWDLTDSSANPDLVNIDALLRYFAVPTTTKILVVGHSNGGGFSVRFANNTERKAFVKAVQVSNHPGSSTIFSSSSYSFPTLFNYADCDPIINPTNVRNSISVLQGRGVPILENDLDSTYSQGSYSDCHEFVDTFQTTNQFFTSYL